MGHLSEVENVYNNTIYPLVRSVSKKFFVHFFYFIHTQQRKQKSSLFNNIMKGIFLGGLFAILHPNKMRIYFRIYVQKKLQNSRYLSHDQ